MGLGGTKAQRARSRPKEPLEYDGLKTLTRVEVVTSFSRLMRMNKEQLSAYLQKPDTSAADLMVGSVMVKCIQNGDANRMNAILDRVIGKVPDKLEMTGEVNVNAMLVDAIGDFVKKRRMLDNREKREYAENESDQSGSETV